MGMEATRMLPQHALTTTGKTYEPCPDKHIIYSACFQKFERLYDLVKSEFVSPTALATESSIP